MTVGVPDERPFVVTCAKGNTAMTNAKTNPVQIMFLVETSQLFLNPTLADEPGLDDLRQPHIADQRQQQKRPIERRQGNKPEWCRERRVGKIRAECHNDDRRQSELPTSARVDERNEIGANNVNDERLCHERFYKPARVK